MKTKKWITLTLLAVGIIFFSLHIQAQYNQQNRNSNQNQGQGFNNQGRMHHPPHPVMTVLDADRDHTISAAEIAGATKALLTLDKNKDGKLSQDEMRPQRPNRRQGGMQRGNNQSQQGGNNYQGQQGQQGQRGQQGQQGMRNNRRRPPKLPALTAMDTDGNNELSAAELANAPNSLLTLEKNKDGKLSHDEIRPQPPNRRQQGNNNRNNRRPQNQ